MNTDKTELSDGKSVQFHPVFLLHGANKVPFKVGFLSIATEQVLLTQAMIY